MKIEEVILGWPFIVQLTKILLLTIALEIPGTTLGQFLTMQFITPFLNATEA
ncbi:hypothetical protein KHS38_09630 [Mucilaginibacter sp. Bleaf8]|uniref:hypothetical protein n=1 Tax=Mucilaginibacter sp. Bleaf8 TaxID=2834430 RepID=UPI001BD0EC8E|nr:hypothetical protein [Mucilaginibacter sp. Bleaf8]MBS7564663.1 hypothetical protein [Mucilaginibacter sp. Bleaf8]